MPENRISPQQRARLHRMLRDISADPALRDRCLTDLPGVLRKYQLQRVAAFDGVTLDLYRSQRTAAGTLSPADRERIARLAQDLKTHPQLQARMARTPSAVLADYQLADSILARNLHQPVPHTVTTALMTPNVLVHIDMIVEHVDTPPQHVDESDPIHVDMNSHIDFLMPVQDLMHVDMPEGPGHADEGVVINDIIHVDEQAHADENPVEHQDAVTAPHVDVPIHVDFDENV
jgi:hypothetical protein